MPSPYFTEDHALFRQSVRQFIETEVVPHASEWENQQQIPRHIWQRMGELGFLGINLPEKYGGSEADFFYSVVFLEELSRCTMGGFAAAVSVHQYMAIAHLAQVGSEYLKQTYLSAAIRGAKIGALAISEPGAGSDVANLRTTAVHDGDFYRINGSKTFITNGVYGDFVVLACRTNPQEKGVGGISLILVEQGTAGFSTNKLKKIGWHSSDTAELFFDNVRVPTQNLIGQEGQGFYYIMDSFQLERLVAGIGSVAAADYGIEITRQYMHERKAFGRPIAKFQALRHELVNLATELEAAKHLTYYAAWLYDNKHFGVKECSMVKLLTSELAKKVADTCLQFFGGYGYIEEYPIARMFRDARVGTIVGGTSQIMREILSKIVIDDIQYESAYQSNKKGANHDLASGKSHKNGTGTLQQSKPTTARDIILSLAHRYKSTKKPDYQTTVHFKISGERGGEFTVTIQNGSCRVSEGLHGEPKCIVTTKDKIYEDIELGRTNPQMAVMMGKIHLSNLPEMMTFTSLFKKITIQR